MPEDQVKRLGRPPGTGLHGRRRYMTEQELEAFMAQARRSGPKYSLLYSLTYFYAMRVAEVVSLLLTDLPPTKTHQVTIRAVKGGRERTYDLPEQIEAKLRRWLKARRDLPGASENPYLFPSVTLPRTGHLSRDAAQATFRQLCRKAKVPMPRSIHDLRHSSCQSAIRGGMNVAEVKGLLRHRDIQSTKVYIDDEITAERQAERARKEAKFL